MKPPGFVLPSQATLVSRPPEEPGWSHEIKFDGYRLLARKDSDTVRLWARTTSDYTSRLTCLRNAVSALPARGALIDGEAVVLSPDGHSDFHALRSHEGQSQAVLVAFDLLELDGEDLRSKPIEKRRALLKRLVTSRKAVQAGIQLSEPIVGNPDAIFRHACAMGLEGIVSKRLGSRYVPGKTRSWLKVKNPTFKRIDYG